MIKKKISMKATENLSMITIENLSMISAENLSRITTENPSSITQENLSMITENLTYNENLTTYIKNTLGDSHINWATLLPLTVIYSLFLVVGVCGNLATCMVIMSNEYMRTATNVYLTNLAIADIATLVISKIFPFQSISCCNVIFFKEYTLH